MAIEDDDKPKKKISHESAGSSLPSVDELGERIAWRRRKSSACIRRGQKACVKGRGRQFFQVLREALFECVSSGKLEWERSLKDTLFYLRSVKLSGS